jgi:hypothetical protein
MGGGPAAAAATDSLVSIDGLNFRVRLSHMSFEIGNSSCEHEWVEYDDSGAYNDGLNCPTVAICNRCGASKDIRSKYTETNKLKWYENLLLLLGTLVFMLYFAIIAPIILLICIIKDEIAS